MEKKNWLMWVLLKLWAFVLFIVSTIEDISTFIREGGKGSAFSHRRGIAVAFVISTIYSISLALRSFADLLKYGWVAALVFIPVFFCGFFAAVFSYYASSKDFDHTISAVGTVFSGQTIDIKLPHLVTDSEGIEAEGYPGTLPEGTSIDGA